jgi:hypothetical protein
LKDQWAEGQLQSEDPQVTTVANAEALGQVKLLKDLHEMDYERFSQVVSDD